MNHKPLVIYHSPCQDGFTAAWAVWKSHPDWEFYPAKHGDPPPCVNGRDVYMVDFSYKRPVLLEMAAVATRIVILDHHKTAQDSLVDLPNNVEVIFDMKKSGAHIAWNYFHPTKPLPLLIVVVEDRDLWTFKYPTTKPISAYLFSQPYDFNIWSRIVDYGSNLDTIISSGQAILDNHKKYTEELSRLKFRTTIAGYKIWAVNVPYNYSSDMGELLDKGEPFTATFFYDGPREKMVFSLRSDENGIDVSEIAKKFGGGGHKHAAGFEINAPAKESGEGVKYNEV